MMAVERWALKGVARAWVLPMLIIGCTERADPGEGDPGREADASSAGHGDGAGAGDDATSLDPPDGGVDANEGGGLDDSGTVSDGGTGGKGEPCRLGDNEALVIAEGLASDPVALGVDGSDVYWLELGRLGQNDGVVMRASLDGGAAMEVANAGGNPVHSGGHVAVSDAGIFWMTVREGSVAGKPEPLEHSLMKVAKTGGQPVAVASYPWMHRATDVTLLGDRVYWLIGNEIESVGIGGSDVQAGAGASSPLYRLATDGRDLYFTDSSFGGGQGEVWQGMTVYRVRPPATSAERLYDTNTWGVEEEQPRAPKVAGNGMDVAFTTDRHVRVVPVTGGEARELAMADTVITSLAMDGTHVYWGTQRLSWGQGDTPGPSVYCVPVGGGSVVTVASSTGEARGLTVRDGYLYWLEADYTNPGFRPRVMRVATK